MGNYECAIDYVYKISKNFTVQQNNAYKEKQIRFRIISSDWPKGKICGERKKWDKLHN